MTPSRLALTLALLGVGLFIAAIAYSAAREGLIVLGLFFLFLAGGVLNWDRRGGH